MLCNADYKLAFCEDRISDSDMKSTLLLEILVLVELICQAHITATLVFVMFVSAEREDRPGSDMMKILYTTKHSEV